jgi:hypothetical protein
METWHGCVHLVEANVDPSSKLVCNVQRRIGYTCRVEDVAYGSFPVIRTRLGCCKVADALRYMCTSCDPRNSCCSNYEHCVSCCMSPLSRESRRPTLRGRGRGRGKYTGPPVVDGGNAPDDDFARCESACRTGSESLVHENAYIHSRHHCFGDKPPQFNRQSHYGVFGFIRPIWKKGSRPPGN